MVFIILHNSQRIRYPMKGRWQEISELAGLCLRRVRATVRRSDFEHRPLPTDPTADTHRWDLGGGGGGGWGSKFSDLWETGQGSSKVVSKGVKDVWGRVVHH